MSEATHVTNSAGPEGTSKLRSQERFRSSRSQSLPSIKLTKKTNSPTSPILGFFQSFTVQTRPATRRSSFVSEYENGEKTNPLFASGSEDNQEDTGQASKLSNSSFEDFQKLKQNNFLKNEGKKKLEVNLKLI
jgi:hypothetical protein